MGVDGKTTIILQVIKHLRNFPRNKVAVGKWSGAFDKAVKDLKLVQGEHYFYFNDRWGQTRETEMGGRAKTYNEKLHEFSKKFMPSKKAVYIHHKRGSKRCCRTFRV